MENEDEEVKKRLVIEARARNISHNVRCTECGSQSIEDSQADIAILLRQDLFLKMLVNLNVMKGRNIWNPFLVSLYDESGCIKRTLIRNEIQSGKTDKEIYKKLEEDYGETVLYAPKFDMQTAALWLSPLLVAGAAAGVWAYNKHRQRTNVHIMALNLVRGVPLTPKEKETMLDLLTPPPSPRGAPSSWWKRWLGQ